MQKRSSPVPGDSGAGSLQSPGLRHALELSPPTADPTAKDSLADLTAHVGDAAGSIRFRRLREHAKGGLGEVFVALDSEVSEGALEGDSGSPCGPPREPRALYAESGVTGSLEHPGIVPSYGMGVYPDGRPYYVMRFIKGDSLKEAIAAFQVSPSPRIPPLRCRSASCSRISSPSANAYAQSGRDPPYLPSMTLPGLRSRCSTPRLWA